MNNTLPTINTVPKFNWKHPVKTLVDRQTARQWPHDHCRITRKYDGEFCVREVAGRTLLGELVKPKSGGLFTIGDRKRLEHFNFFAAFDCVTANGKSIAHLPMNDRLFQMEVALSRYSDEFPLIIAKTVTDIDAVFAAGGEGVVRNEWSEPYGKITVCKAGEIYLCRVCSIGGSQSVGIEIVEVQPGGITPKPCFVPLRGGKCDQVRVGSLIRVSGMGLTNDGKIREPQPCRDWLVQY